MKINNSSVGIISAITIVVSLFLSSFTANTNHASHPSNLLNTTQFSVPIGDLVKW
jgi:hypothetical protein